MNQKQAMKFLQEFVCIPEYSLKKNLVSYKKDIKYYKSEIPKYEKQLENITSKKKLITYKLKKYNKARKEGKTINESRKNLWGVLRVLVSRQSYDANLDYLHHRIVDNNYWISDKKARLKDAKLKLKVLENKSKAIDDKMKLQAKLLAQTVNDLKIKNLKMLKKTSEMYFIMPVRNAVPKAVQEFKSGHELNYDIEVRMNAYGEFRARLIPSQRRIIIRSKGKYSISKFGRSGLIKVHIHGSAGNPIHWRGLCQGGSRGYHYDEYIKLCNPSAILRVACYMYHSFNPLDTYGNLEKQELFVKLFPNKFFTKIKRKPLDLSKKSDLDSVQAWLGKGIVAKAGGKV